MNCAAPRRHYRKPVAGCPRRPGSIVQIPPAGAASPLLDACLAVQRMDQKKGVETYQGGGATSGDKLKKPDSLAGYRNPFCMWPYRI